MAVQIAFVFQSPDRTDYLNQRLAGLIGKGIYSGAELTPTGAGLTATRAPFLALGRDGITIWDTEVGTFNYTTGQPNYHCILGKYNPLGTPSTPVVQELVLSEAAYNAHPDKAYLIIVGVVEPAGSVLVAGEIDYTLRDEVGPFGRAQLRGVVDTEGELPTGTPNWNRSGDLYICNDDPAPGGGGLYMWDGSTSSWRLVAAKGAATLDGAYDNNGAGGPPGYGRFIEVDAGAVELLQSNTSQRENDIANAALRIRKTSTATGDGALDIVFPQDKDTAGLLIRSLFTSGTLVQANEPVNVSGSTITGTRSGPSSNWNSASIHKAHMLLVELSGSSVGNDGLFIALPSGPNTCSIKTLNAVAPTLANELGITANFYSVRWAIGATGVARLTEYDLGSSSVASTEFYGNVGTGGVGKVVYYAPGTLNYVFQYRATIAGGTSDVVFYLTDGGGVVIRPTTSPDTHSLDAEQSHGSFAAVYGHHTTTGHGGRFTSVDGYGVYAQSTNSIAIYATTTSGAWNLPAIRAYGNAATGVLSTVTGTSAAILGSSTGVGGRGVWGELNNASDVTGYGVYAKHAGDGVAFFCEALGAGGGGATPTGIRSEVNGDDGIAIKGIVSGGTVSTTEGSVGVWGVHTGGANPDGIGILGDNAPITVDIGAVWGRSFGFGAGVRGESLGGPGVLGYSVLPGQYGVEGNSFGYEVPKTISVVIPLQQLVEDYGSTETWVVLQSSTPTDSAVRLYNRQQVGETVKMLWDGLPQSAVLNHVDILWFQNNSSSGDEMRLYVQKHTMSQITTGNVAGSPTTFTNLNSTQQYIDWAPTANNTSVQRFTCNVSTAARTFLKGTDLLNITIKSCGDARDCYVYWIRANFTFQTVANYPHTSA